MKPHKFEISFKEIDSLLSQFIVPKSFEGLISDCLTSFDASIQTAEKVEDYRYLDVFISKRHLIEHAYIFYWDYKTTLPFFIEKDKTIGIDALAGIYFSLSRTIQKDCFIDLIMNICDRELIDSTDILDKFHRLLDERSRYYRLEHEKIQNNDTCPCGSGRKYKQCHGKKAA